MNQRWQKFVDAFDGNGAEACRIAGYKGSVQALSTQAARLLKKAEIVEAIQKRTKKSTAKVIASREERQAFWTQIQNDGSQEMRDRLKASELLARSEGDFIERHEHTGVVGGIIYLPEQKKSEERPAIEATKKEET